MLNGEEGTLNLVIIEKFETWCKMSRQKYFDVKDKHKNVFCYVSDDIPGFVKQWLIQIVRL